MRKAYSSSSKNGAARALASFLAAGLIAAFCGCGSPRDEVAAKTFECADSGERFEVTYGELKDPDIRNTWANPASPSNAAYAARWMLTRFTTARSAVNGIASETGTNTPMP